MDFNTNLYPHSYVDECFSLYSIPSKTEELKPVTYWGGDFVELKDSLTNAGLYSNKTPAMRMRLKGIADKVEELKQPGESISYVFYQTNNKMNKPAIIVCLERNWDKRGRVICSAVDTIIENDHHRFGNRCDFYVGEWSEEYTKKKGAKYIWVNMSKRISEKPITYRGKLKQPTVSVVAVAVPAAPETSIDIEPYESNPENLDAVRPEPGTLFEYSPEDYDNEPPSEYSVLDDAPDTGIIETTPGVYRFISWPQALERRRKGDEELIRLLGEAA